MRLIRRRWKKGSFALKIKRARLPAYNRGGCGNREQPAAGFLRGRGVGRVGGMGFKVGRWGKRYLFLFLGECG